MKPLQPVTNPKIVVIGDIILDIITTPFPIQNELLLEEKETFVENISFKPGGCAGNFALVYKSVFSTNNLHIISRLGMQPFGDYIIQEFESNNIQCHFFKDSTVQTQTTVAITFNDGKRHFITSLGGLEHFQLSDVQKDLLVDADHIAYRGVWFSERLLSQAQVLLKWIKENSDAKISVDLGYDPLWTREDENSEIRKKTEEKKANLLSCLKYVDFLFGNEVEILHLTESKNLDDGIRKLFSRGVKKIILHQGAKGSSIYILNKGKKLKEFEVHHIPAPKVEIINPVGTGDTYDSILIGFNVKGYDILEAAKFATKGAAFSISHPVGTKIPKHFFETNNEN